MRTTADKFWFIKNHPKFMYKDLDGVEFDFEVHNVCPMTNRIERYEPLNTTPQIWVEVMTPFFCEDTNSWERCHEWDLDGGGYTMDEAVDDVYKKVLEKYGDYSQEEYDAKWDGLYNPNNTFSNSIMSQQLNSLTSSIWEDNHSYRDDVIAFDEKDNYENDLQTYYNTYNALKTFQLAAPPEQQNEIRIQIENIEHDIWVLLMSLHWGIDYT